jgi:hypothetical protein
MPEKSANWTELREFHAVDLAQSFALSWGTESGSLLIDVDLFLCPEHAFYEQPRPRERGCFRAATLEFPRCTWLESAVFQDVATSVEATAAKLASGRISGLRLVDEGRYTIDGAFGKVEIHAERPILRISELST